MSSRPAGLSALLLLLSILVPAAALVAQQRGEDVPAALVVKVEGDLDTPMLALIQRAIREVKGGGTQYLVLDIGSTAFRPDEIRRAAQLLPDLQDEALATVAYIDEMTFPASTLLALGCDQVFMKRGAQLSGFTAVEADFTELRRMMAGALDQTTRKSDSLKLLVQAMVDAEMRLWEVTYKDLSGLETTTVVEATRLEQMRADPNITFAINPVPFDIRPLTLDAQRALDLGLITGMEDSLENMMKERLLLDSSQIGYMGSSWSESAVTWLNGMREVLFVLGFILLLIEFKTPGFALPGILGLVMFGLAFFGSYMVGLATITEILLFFLGLGLLATEIYVFPGMVVFGVAGFLCIVSGLIFAQQKFYFPANPAETSIMLNNLINFGLVMVLVMLGIWSVYANIHRIPILKNAVQTPPQAHDAGVGSMDVHGRLLATLAGKQGVLATDLRPAGVVTIEGEPYDVVSDGLFLDKGSTVRVIEVRGNRVVVAPVAGVDVTGDVGVDVIGDGDGDADGDADRGVDDGVNRGVDGGVNRGIDGGAERGQVGIPLLALLVLIGLALVVAEIFFVSFGILAVLSGLALVSAVFLAFTQEGPVVGFAFLSVCAVAVPLAVNFAFKVLPRLPFGKQLYLAGNKHEDVTGGAQEAGISALLDKQGVALCDLRPSGYAQIDGERVDVVTRGEPIEKGSPLRVVKVESNQVIVRLERS